jgi:hypothetical protein
MPDYVKVSLALEGFGDVVPREYPDGTTLMACALACGFRADTSTWTVNGTVADPSYRLKAGDVIGFSPKNMKHAAG